MGSEESLEVGHELLPEGDLASPAILLQGLRDETVEGAHVAAVEQVERQILVNEQLVSSRRLPRLQPSSDLARATRAAPSRPGCYRRAASSPSPRAGSDDRPQLDVAWSQRPALQLDPFREERVGVPIPAIASATRHSADGKSAMETSGVERLDERDEMTKPTFRVLQPTKNVGHAHCAGRRWIWPFSTEDQ